MSAHKDWKASQPETQDPGVRLVRRSKSKPPDQSSPASQENAVIVSLHYLKQNIIIALRHSWLATG